MKRHGGRGGSEGRGRDARGGQGRARPQGGGRGTAGARSPGPSRAPQGGEGEIPPRPRNERERFLERHPHHDERRPGARPGRGGGRDREAERDEREAIAAKLTEGIPAPFEIVYGMNPVREALLAARRKFRRLLVARREDSPESEALLKLAAERSVPVMHVEREALDTVISGDGEAQGVQGIALVATPYRYYSIEELAGTKEESGAEGARGSSPGEPAGSPKGDQGRKIHRRRILALDEIEDPRNLGAMARTAEAAGFRGLVLQEHRAAAATPTAVKASAGAVEHLRIARETNLSTALERLKEHGYWVVGLDATPDATDIYAADLDMDLVLVIGAEGKGLRPRVRSICDLVVRLPMGGKVGSLNASAACAAAVYQVLRADRV